MPNDIVVSLTQGQAEFVASKAKFPLYCAGYGAGKSHVMGFCVATDLMHSATCVVGVYEPEWTHIKSIAVPRICHWLDEFGIKYKTNWQDHCIYTSSSGVGDVLLKTMDNPDALVAYETYRSHIDELDTLNADKAEAVFFKVMGRNRQAPKDVPKEHREFIEKNQRWECINRIYSYTTPEGFKFCHKMWGLDGENASRNKEFQLYKGKTQDNPILTEAYLDQLSAAYPANLLKAYMEGEFVNLESGTVYHTFNRHTHYSNRVVELSLIHI